MFHELKHNQHIFDSPFYVPKKSPSPINNKGEGMPPSLPPSHWALRPPSIGALQFNSNDYMKGNKKKSLEVRRRTRVLLHSS